MTVQMVPPLPVSPAARLQPAAAGAPAIVVLLAIAENDVTRYPTGAFTTMAAHTTAEAIEAIERIRPRVLAIDWDLPAIDGIALCRLAAQLASPTLLVTTGSVERVPAAIKAGCHSVLLKPFSLNLAAARFGRLCRELSVSMSPAVRAVVERGTNRTMPDIVCPRCGGTGATSFDHASYRRAWYACLPCEHVWLGARQE
jgi:CheY-like chemotaxis protein